MGQVDLNKYIASLVDVPTGVKNLADLIAFNIENAKEELVPPFHADQSQSVHSDSRHKLRTANLFVTGIADSSNLRLRMLTTSIMLLSQRT